jgi:dihydroorotate dehydrogenase
LLKIAPDLSDDAAGSVVTLAEELGLDGIIATNTTLDHASIERERDEAGGLSGEPLRERSTTLIRAIRRATRLPVIGVGGIMNGDDAREKFEAGAELLQLYTGFIYRGPGLLREISRICS